MVENDDIDIEKLEKYELNKYKQILAENDLVYLKWATPMTKIIRVLEIRKTDKYQTSQVFGFDLIDRKRVMFFVPQSLQTQFNNLEVTEGTEIMIKYFGKIDSPNGKRKFHSFYVKKL